MAVTYTYYAQGRKITVGTGVPAHSAVAGDTYTDLTSGLQYTYTTAWVSVGVGSSAVSNSSSSLAYGSSITATAPSAIKGITAQYVDSNGVVIDASQQMAFGIRNVQAITTFTADAIRAIELYATDSIKTCKLANGNFAILYRTVNTWKCQLWDGTAYTQIGSTITLETSAPTATFHHGHICALTGNRFCVMWSNSTGSNLLKYAIYDNTCTVYLAATQIAAVNGGYHACCETLEGHIIFAYSATYSQYTIWNITGTVVEAATQLAATGPGRGNSVAQLSNGYIVFVNEGATNIGRYAILDTSTNASTVKVTYTEALDNLSGTGTSTDVWALPNKNFAIISNDETSTNSNMVVVYQYVSNTSWISSQTRQPFVQYSANVYPSWSAGDLGQGLIMAGYPSVIINGGYMPMASIMEGENAKNINYGQQSSYIPYANKLATSSAVRAIFLDNKKMAFFWKDATDSSKGKFIIVQIEHFKISVSGLVVTLANYTGSTQNVLLTVQY